jgi:DNA primase
LRDLVKEIADKDVRTAYGEELSQRLNAQFQPTKREGGYNQSGSGQAGNPFRRSAQWSGRGQGRSDRGMGFRFTAPARPTPGLKSPSQWVREASLVLAAINHPALLERCESAYFELDLADPGLKALLGEVLAAISTDPALDSAGLRSHLTKTGAAGTLERVTSDPQLGKHRFLRPETEIDEVEQGFRNALAHHLFESTHKQEVARSASQIFTDGDDAWKAAAAAREELINSSKPEEVGDEGDSPRRFADALEKMRETVAKKGGR